MHFSLAIRTARKARNLTQQQLGTLAGVSRQAVNLIENGGGRVRTLEALAEHAPFEITHVAQGGSLGSKLLAARRKRGWSQAETASRSGTAINTVASLERGGGSVIALQRVLRAISPNARVLAAKQLPKRTGSFPTVLGTPNPDRHKSDYYPTPAAIVRLLLDHEEFTHEQTILEPAVGRARVIERVLNERGHRNVRCSDIEGDGVERRCFFDLEEPVHTVLTNPPFRLHREFILHAKRVATHKIALLLPLNHLTGAARHADVWSDGDFPLARVLILNRGVNFAAPDPFAEHFETSQMYVAWYIFERGHEGDPIMRWIDNHQMVARKSGGFEKRRESS